MTQEKRIYLLDTNVLVHDPEAIFSFEGAQVAIPETALEELDRFKGENSQRGFNTREVIRFLDLLRERGSLAKGVSLDNKGTLRVVFVPREEANQAVLLPATPDNKILHAALSLKAQGYEVRFISKDLNMRVKADVIGIQAFDYLKDIVEEKQFYKGWVTLDVPAVQLKREVPQDLLAFADSYAFSLNEAAIVQSQHNPFNYRVFRYTGAKQFKPVNVPPLFGNIAPRNPQQLIALDLLLDPSIELITLLGPAGTGKTFLALVAALQSLLDGRFEKIMVTRPVIPLGPDIGYLPGSLQEKLYNWMQPIYDNMDFIMHAANAQHRKLGIYREDHEGSHHEQRSHGKHKKRRHDDRHDDGHRERSGQRVPALDELVKKGKISLEAITYMRGRSIPYQFIFIDEVQNLTPHEVKTLISRVGQGSKIVLAGDPYQIDSPYLDFSSNGLVVASQRFKGQALFGTVFLETSERSELSKLAGQLL